MSCWFFSVSHTFSLLLLWKWGWHLPSSLHTWCWIGNQKSNFINLLLSHNHTVSGLLILYSSAPAVVVVQLLSHIQFFATPWTATYQAPLSFTISWSLLKLMSLESMMPSSHFILCHPILLLTSILYPVSGSFPMSWLFMSGGQSTVALASASALPVNSQVGFPLGVTGLISLLSKGLSRVFSSTRVQKFFSSTINSLVPHLLCDSGHKCSKLGKKPQRSFSEWINKLWHIHTTEYCSGHTQTHTHTTTTTN